jgi:hypothetical protein
MLKESDAGELLRKGYVARVHSDAERLSIEQWVEKNLAPSFTRGKRDALDEHFGVTK